MNSYEEKRMAKIERLHDLADNARRESDQRLNKAHQMADIIPFGQPILVGHHSESADRNYRGRIESNYRKGFELSSKADYYERRAKAAEENKAIFSDDPAAVEKIADKITRLEKQQEYMKAANKLVRVGNREGLADMGFSEKVIEGLLTPDFCGRIGFPDYMTTNNGANIRRLKQRAETLEKRAQDTTTEKEINGIKIIDNVEDNRLQLFFPGKPSDEIRQQLKSYGFRWTPSVGCWQAYRNNRATWAADKIIKSIAF